MQLDDRSRAVIARFRPALDARHKVGDAYYVHTDAVAPFPVLTKLKEHLTLTPCRGGSSAPAGTSTSAKPKKRTADAVEDETPFPVWTP